MTGKTKKNKKKFSISAEKCTGCSYCKLNCPADAIVVRNAIAVRTGACKKCDTCVWVCPVQAISFS